MVVDFFLMDIHWPLNLLCKIFMVFMASNLAIYTYIMLAAAVQCGDLSTISDGSISYTPPCQVSPSLPDGKRYVGTIATYSCSPGYQLVGGSVRACGPDGTWNETVPTCGMQVYNFYIIMCLTCISYNSLYHL